MAVILDLRPLFPFASRRAIGGGGDTVAEDTVWLEVNEARVRIVAESDTPSLERWRVCS